MTRILKTLTLGSILAGLLVLVGAAPAVARSSSAAPCWKQLINDWYDGRIDKTYPIPCYQDALRHLPEDVQTYSSARDDINRALQAVIQSKRHPGGSTASTGGGQASGPSGGGKSSGTSGGGKTSGPSSGGKTPGPSGAGKGSGGSGTGKQGGGQRGRAKSSTPTVGGGEPRSGGPLNTAIKNLGPDNADSVPVPLLVLGGIALLLLAAGAAGFTVRRVQARRAQTPPDAGP